MNVVIQAGQEPNAALHWYTDLIAKKAPIGTVQQARSALARWWTYCDQPEHIATLPPARGKQREHRQGLTDGQLALYLFEAAKQKDPARTILALLPRTGLRISEICQLRMDQIKSTDDKVHYFSFRGKGDKPRVVPLGPEGLAVLTDYLERRAKGRPMRDLRFYSPVAEPHTTDQTQFAAFVGALSRIVQTLLVYPLTYYGIHTQPEPWSMVWTWLASNPFWVMARSVLLSGIFTRPCKTSPQRLQRCRGSDQGGNHVKGG